MPNRTQTLSVELEREIERRREQAAELRDQASKTTAAPVAKSYLREAKARDLDTDRLQALLSQPEHQGDGHRVEVQFDGDSAVWAKLIHPEHGCKPPVDEESGEAIEGEDCWIAGWYDEYGIDLLHGKTTLAVTGKWDGDVARLVVDEPQPPAPVLSDEESERTGEIADAMSRENPTFWAKDIDWLRNLASQVDQLVARGEANGKLALELEADRDLWRNRARDLASREHRGEECDGSGVLRLKEGEHEPAYPCPGRRRCQPPAGEVRERLLKLADTIGAVHKPSADPDLHEDDARFLRAVALGCGIDEERLRERLLSDPVLDAATGAAYTQPISSNRREDMRAAFEAALDAAFPPPPDSQGDQERPSGWNLIHKAHADRAEIVVCTGPQRLHQVGHVVTITERAFTLQRGEGRSLVPWPIVVGAWLREGVGSNRPCPHCDGPDCNPAPTQVEGDETDVPSQVDAPSVPDQFEGEDEEDWPEVVLYRSNPGAPPKSIAKKPVEPNGTTLQRYLPATSQDADLRALYETYKQRYEEELRLAQQEREQLLGKVAKWRGRASKAEAERDERLKVPDWPYAEEVEKLATEYAEWSSNKPFAERHPKNQAHWRKVTLFLLTLRADGFLREQAETALEELAEEFERRATANETARDEDGEAQNVDGEAYHQGRGHANRQAASLAREKAAELKEGEGENGENAVKSS